MRTIGSAKADPELLASLLSARSDAEATVAFSLLRYSLSERELIEMANLREVIRLLPTEPFRTGDSLEMLERVGSYEATGRSYRRAFDSTAGVFGVEFLGTGHACRGIVIHTPSGRLPVVSTDWVIIDRQVLALLIEHRIVLDAILEGLELLGCALVPPIYVTSHDFVAEHAATAAREAFTGLF
jgi:hypothetical protein